MSLGARSFILLLGFLIFMLTFELVRRKRFREELSILWFFVAVLVAGGAFADIIINPFAQILGIGYPPIIIIVFLIIILITAVMFFSVVISDLKGKVKEINQKLAYLEFEMEERKLYEKDNSKREL